MEGIVIAIISEDINNIIFLLAEHKKNMASLYNTYYAQFPSQTYWLTLAQSKQKNNQIIQSINFVIKPSSNVLNDAIFRSAAIKTSLEWIARLIGESKGHSIINALCYSLDLEQAKIEQKYFDAFKDRSKQIQDILPIIIEKNQYDIDLLKYKLANAKQKQANTLNFISQLEQN